MEWEVLLTPTLYNSGKLCKLFRYMGCKENKWDCEEEGSGGCFQRMKVLVAYLDGDKIEREQRGIMVWSK